jgi:hypothetical protein
MRYNVIFSENRFIPNLYVGCEFGMPTEIIFDSELYTRMNRSSVNLLFEVAPYIGVEYKLLDNLYLNLAWAMGYSGIILRDPEVEQNEDFEWGKNNFIDYSGITLGISYQIHRNKLQRDKDGTIDNYKDTHKGKKREFDN